MNLDELKFENETMEHQQEVAKNIIRFTVWLLEEEDINEKVGPVPESPSYKQLFNLHNFVAHLLNRASFHDASKLKNPEREGFMTYAPQLKKLTYGSEEYAATLKEMNTTINKHYEENRHHPEHFTDGINGMSLVDIIEMLCDWMAATKRRADGDIAKSIIVNKKRFDMSDSLTELLTDTANRILGNEVVDGLRGTYKSLIFRNSDACGACMDEQIWQIMQNPH